MNELGIASSVRSLDLDVSLDHLNANVGCRCRGYGSGDAGAHQEGSKVSPRDVSATRLFPRLAFFVVLRTFLAQNLPHFDGRPHRRIIESLRTGRYMPIAGSDS